MIKSLEAKKEEEMFLNPSGIHLSLYSYDDIFSDFDPRPLSHRALSEDFLEEAKNISKQKDSNKTGLRLSIPEKTKDEEKEKIIKRRMKDHFKKHHDISQKDLGKKKRFGWTFVLSGIITMFLAAYVYFQFGESTMLTSFLVILLEPAGWFLFWEGLDVVIFDVKEITPQAEFYKNMSQGEIIFSYY